MQFRDDVERVFWGQAYAAAIALGRNWPCYDVADQAVEFMRMRDTERATKVPETASITFNVEGTAGAAEAYREKVE